METCDVTSWVGVAGVIMSLIEFWLGKTDKVAAGSTLELILNAIKQLIGFFNKKQQE